MADDYLTNNPELEALFQRYESAPDSHVFAPLADTYRKAGLLEEATAICDQGVKKHPEYPSGYVVQGKCYFDLEQLGKSEQAFRKVLELDQENLVALKFIGLIHAKRGEDAEAMEHFKHVLALDPDDREIKDKLEDLEEEPAEILEAVDDEFEGEPISLGSGGGTSDELATVTLADIYAEQGYIGKAEKIYREILENEPDNENIRSKLEELHSGRSSSKIGDWLDDKESKDDSTDRDDASRQDVKEDKGDVTRKESRAYDFVVPDGWDTEPLDNESEPYEDEPESSETAAVDAAPAEGSEEPSYDEEITPGQPMPDKRSYNQFKRWLENHSK